MSRYHKDADWQGLIESVVADAGEAYRKAAAKLQVQPDARARRSMEQIEEFFLSKFFELMCGLDGAAIVRDLRRQCFPEEDGSSAQTEVTADGRCEMD